MDIKLCADARIDIRGHEELFEQFLDRSSDACSRAASMMYNWIEGNHYLKDIDESLPDCDRRIHDLFRECYENGKAKGNTPRDMFFALCSRASGKVKNEYVKKAYAIQQDGAILDCKSIFGTNKHSKVGRYVMQGFGHAFSFFSNRKNWYTELDEWRIKRQEFLDRNPDYCQKFRTIIESIEKEWSRRSGKRCMLTTSYWTSDEVKRVIADLNIDTDGIDDGILKAHRYYRREIRHPKKKPTWNPTCGQVDLTKNTDYVLRDVEYSDRIVDDLPVSLRGSISFRDLNLSVKNLKIWFRHLPQVVQSSGRPQPESMSGLRIQSIRDGYAQCRFLASSKVEIPKTADWNEIGYLDLGWRRKSVGLVGNDIFFLEGLQKSSRHVERYINRYSDLYREHKKIPKGLRKKRKAYLDAIQKETAYRIISPFIRRGVKFIVAEKPNGRKKRFKAPLTGRKQETRTNRMLRSQRLQNGFWESLEHVCHRHGISLRAFKFSNGAKSRKDRKNHRPSQTCTKCNSLGKRYNWSDKGLVEHRYGDILVCSCGNHIDSDVAAVRNMARKDHKNIEKRLPFFAPGTKILPKDEVKINNVVLKIQDSTLSRDKAKAVDR